jgi:hypothetical protein
MQQVDICQWHTGHTAVVAHRIRIDDGEFADHRTGPTDRIRRRLALHDETSSIDTRQLTSSDFPL